MTDKNNWARISELFEKAMALPQEEQRAWLEAECDGDPDILQEVLALLNYDAEQTGGIRASVQSVAADLGNTSDAQYLGVQVGNYRISSKLAEGGMGTIYLADHAADDFDRRVAVKLLPKHRLDTDAARRFVDERRILAGLKHPNIAALIDGGTMPDGVPYIVMDYIDGETIDKYCATNKLDNAAVIGLVRVVCDAVQYAHQKLVIHRDIKPSNIIVNKRGVPMLLDFGIAKLLSTEDDDNQKTLDGGRALTPLYASPEQIEGLPITTAADVYGIGILLYRLLTGQTPYRPTGNTPRELEQAILDQTPEKPSTAVANLADGRGDSSWAQRQQRALRGELDTILLTALRKTPERRYQSVAALADDLDRYRERRPIAARADSPLYVLRKFIARNRWPVGFGAAAIAAAIGLVGYYTSELKIERDTAEQTAAFLSDIFAATDPYQKNRDGLTVEALLDAGLQKLEDDETLVPEVRARLLTTIALVQRNLGDNERAEELASEALELIEANFGQNDAALLPPLSVIARVRTTAGEYDQAIEFAERMLSVATSAHGAVSRETAQATHQLSILGYRNGDLESMGQWAIESYAIREAIYDENDMAMATGANALALYHWQTGNLAEARDFYAESARIQQEQPERNEIQYAGLLHNLGLLYNDTGDYVSAAKTYAESVRIRRAAGSESDQYLPLTLYALAHTQSRLGDYPSAYGTYLQVLPLQAAVAGREKHLVGYALTGFGMMLEEIGELDGAAALLNEADRIFETLFDGTHKDHASTWIGLARLAVHAGDFDKGRELIERAIAMRTENDGENDFSTLRAYNAAGRLEYQRGDFAAAQKALRHSLAAFMANDGGDHPFSIEARSWLGRVLTASESYDESISQLREALELGEEQFDEGHVENVQRRQWLAEALIANGNSNEGEPMQQAAAAELAIIHQSWVDAVAADPLPAVDDLLSIPGS